MESKPTQLAAPAAETQAEEIVRSPLELLKKKRTLERFSEIIGEKKASSFLASVMQVVSNDKLLSLAAPESVYQAAMVAATLDLPVNNNLGYCYILPFKGKAQLQLGYKGYIQLAQRSGQFAKIEACKVLDGQLLELNPLFGHKFDFSKKGGAVIGYACYFRLINGFEKIVYMSLEEMKAHGLKFSQTFKTGSGVWVSDFDAMAIKTVIKMALSKYAPLSIDMQKAVIADSSVVVNADTNEVEYVDNYEEVSEAEPTEAEKKVAEAMSK